MLSCDEHEKKFKTPGPKEVEEFVLEMNDALFGGLETYGVEQMLK